MLPAMAQQGSKPPRRAPQADPHTTTNPARLHGHVSGAVGALSRLAPALPEAGEAPTPADLVQRYGGSEPVNTTESEGVSNDDGTV